MRKIAVLVTVGLMAVSATTAVASMMPGMPHCVPMGCHDR